MLLLAVMLVRTARSGAAERLAGAIRIPTVSNQDPAQFDTAVFGAFHALLRQRSPRVHARLRRMSADGRGGRRGVRGGGSVML